MTYVSYGNYVICKKNRDVKQWDRISTNKKETV